MAIQSLQASTPKDFRDLDRSYHSRGVSKGAVDGMERNKDNACGRGVRQEIVNWTNTLCLYMG